MPAGSTSERSGRLESIDLLRGLVMVLMALDHVRDYFGDIRADPGNLDTTDPALFFTRWVTHFCAPVFVFLAGTSAWLYGAKRSKGALSKFLLSRGLWLIVLEFTLVYHAWMNSFELGYVFLQVIAAIGFGMVVLAAAVHLPRGVLLAIGLAIVAGHNLLDKSELASSGSLGALLYGSFTFVSVDGTPRLFVIYALLPWVGVMLLGYATGPLFTRERETRRRTLFALGAIATVLFVGLRWSSVYGDPTSYAAQVATLEAAGRESTGMSTVAFLNCTKYPPSLQFLLMTLGPALAFLALIDGGRGFGPVGRALVLFGRVPLFYYVVHIYLIHLGARLYNLVVHGEFLSPLQVAFSGRFPSWFGNGLGTVYIAWGAVILVLYPCCVWFGRLKRNGRSVIWSYL